MMITELFQEGVTNCLVGTRGLLGEGWDASRINVLIDLTTVTTSMSINQLRGRSFRLDKLWPEKVANNWDIICLADEYEKGFDDYLRFQRKHKQLYGVGDDGAIEKGVGHVHAAFTEAKPEGVSETMNIFNEEMLLRAKNRPRTRGLWNIGQPFNAEPKEAVEIKMNLGAGKTFYANGIALNEINNDSLVISIGEAVALSLKELGLINPEAEIGGGSRSGGWMRAYLKEANEEESAIFALAMQEILGPLDNPRYVIPREVKIITDNWFSKMLPEVLAKYVRSKKNKLAMFHSVPKALCKNKEDAVIFQHYWNERVSPGAVMYGHSKSGKQMVSAIKEQGLVPQSSINQKNIFL